MSDGKTRTSHTPGPWVMDGIAIHREGHIHDVCLMAEPAQHPGDMSKPMHNSDANARLIMAAPDLYDALHKARDLLAQTDVEAYELMEVDAAIAKAEGADHE